MSLIALPTAFVSSQRSLPFSVFDAQGNLLLNAGRPLTDGVARRIGEGQAIFGDADEVAPWREVITATLRQLSRRTGPSAMPAPVRLTGVNLATAPAVVDGGPGQTVVNARGVMDRPGSKVNAASASDEGRTIASTLAAALRDSGRLDVDWLTGCVVALAYARELAARAPEVALFLPMQHCAHSHNTYSANHALLCAVLVERVARMLGWSEPEIDSLTCASVTMNVGMTQLQDQLAQQSAPLRPDQRRLVDEHPATGARLLEQAGVTDPLWLDVVRMHHDKDLAERQDTQPAARLARLLQLVDRYTAKMSRRKSRAPMSSLAAARDTCMPREGQPDELASALLKSLGLYPPGTYVRLASGEVGVVVACGARADKPRVAVIVGASGLPLGDPVLRDTTATGREVVAALSAADVQVRMAPDRLLALV
jgi:HD-GYP domain-containing protein (c-di-GMP phosphodiesterase class II)